LNGTGPGAGKTGAGRGTDPQAAGGISPAPGPGGAGNVPAGAPPVRGVDISGGSSQVTIPAFGSDGSSSGDAQSPGRSAVKPQRSFDVDIVATANSGGAFEPYKNLLHGEKHTIYPETYSSLGTAAMEYAEASAGRGVFSPPQGIRTNLPEGLPRARMVVTCTLDASGNLKGIRVLEAGPADMTAKVLAALRSWKFQPAMRDNQPVEVTAILGFGINTNDRF
jgi:TonB family protein